MNNDFLKDYDDILLPEDLQKILHIGRIRSIPTLRTERSNPFVSGRSTVFQNFTFWSICIQI